MLAAALVSVLLLALTGFAMVMAFGTGTKKVAAVLIVVPSNVVAAAVAVVAYYSYSRSC